MLYFTNIFSKCQYNLWSSVGSDLKTKSVNKIAPAGIFSISFISFVGFSWHQVSNGRVINRQRNVLQQDSVLPSINYRNRLTWLN